MLSHKFYQKHKTIQKISFIEDKILGNLPFQVVLHFLIDLGEGNFLHLRNLKSLNKNFFLETLKIDKKYLSTFSAIISKSRIVTTRPNG